LVAGSDAIIVFEVNLGFLFLKDDPLEERSYLGMTKKDNSTDYNSQLFIDCQERYFATKTRRPSTNSNCSSIKRQSQGSSYHSDADSTLDNFAQVTSDDEFY
jgi:hypothetical protein